MTSATKLPIKPEDMPVHQVNVVGTALVLESPVISDAGGKLECTISDYLTKEKPIETQISLIHPPKSRLKNQVLTAKRGSSIFFSGSLTSIENQFYIELHNFNYIRSQSTSNLTQYTKEKMPWLSNPSQTSPSSSNSTAQAIHQKMQEQRSTPTPEKHETKRKFQPNMIPKSPDLTTYALDTKSKEILDDVQEISDNTQEEVSEVTQEILGKVQTPKSILGKRKTRTKKN